MRTACGCRQRREPPEDDGDPDVLAQHEDDCDAMAKRWGCPCAGHTPPAELDPDLAHIAKHYATVTGAPAPPTTCPFACIEKPTPEYQDLAESVTMQEWGERLADTLGRPLSHYDRQCLYFLKINLSRSRKSDETLRAKEEARRRRDGAR